MLPRVPEDSLGSLLFISSTLIFTTSMPSLGAVERSEDKGQLVGAAPDSICGM